MMQLRTRWMVAGLLATGLALSGCADKSGSDESKKGPATLVEIKGSDVQQVVLTDRAVERLDIKLAPVADEAGTKVIPYASVVYDSDGATWAYTSPKPLTFERKPITVTNIAGDKAFLSAGPDTGTKVVTVGTAELYGVEQEIGY
jgi:hypothetical protein